MKTPEVQQLQRNGYYPMNYINNNPVLKDVIDFINRGINGKTFGEIASSLTNVDPYMALADFADYQKAQFASAVAYRDKDLFARMSLMNISGAGVFSADRSIMDYANNIWNTKPVQFEAEKHKKSKKSAPMAPKSEKKPAAKRNAAKKSK